MIATLETGTEQPRYQLVIGGQRVEAASGRRYESADPYLGVPWASAAANITGVLLELGGKSAHLVFEDADLDAACNGVLAGVFEAVHEYTQTKAIWVELTSGTRDPFTLG